MEQYNYLESVKADVKEYISNEINLTEWKDNREELESNLNDELWTTDSVTGNASGSYTCNRWQAEENLCHNLELLKDAFSEFGTKWDYDGAEAADVTIRCYLLGQAIAEVLDDLGM